MKRFTPFTNWQTQCLTQGAFADLNHFFALQNQANWPSLAFLNQCHISHAPSYTHSGHNIEFVDASSLEQDTRYYEEFIYQTGQIPTRKENWHDLFGALIWRLFPKTKALLNQLHYQDIALNGKTVRSKHRNALTLFDECAVVMAITEPSWQAEFNDHQWQRVFVDKRHLWQKQIRPYIFGHANYEMLTQPFIGLTGKALFINVPEELFCNSLAAQYHYLDTALYEMIHTQNSLQDNSLMSPLPLLGVPTWYQANENPTFYENNNYFRPKRRQSRW